MNSDFEHIQRELFMANDLDPSKENNLGNLNHFYIS